MEIVPFADEHVGGAAELLAERHATHRVAEPLLPDREDFAAQIAKEREDATGVVALEDGVVVAYLLGQRRENHLGRHIWSHVAGHASRDPELVRDVYAVAAQRWVEDGLTQHFVFVPSHESPMIDAWFRLCFGASGVLALRETEPEEPFDGGVEIRLGTRDDYPEGVRLELEMARAMQGAPSFSGIDLPTPEEALAEWTGDPEEDYELFVAEREGRIVGQFVLYRRPPDLRVPDGNIDLAEASTDPEARGTGVGRALTAHVIRWAYENGFRTMTTDWRMTNLWASRFWPKRGFRPVFLRLYRSIP
ncbi:MAG TPA: GNAT family N-acetyltransferase [Gaiellaceae bacterium]|nr:GNAT family N-acetyltransferase [Gaiellaceae bacterium]